MTVAALLTDCGSPTYWLWHPTYWLTPYLLTVAALLIDCGSPTYWLWQPYFTLILNFTLAGCSSCMKTICKSTVVTTRANYRDVKELCTLPTNCIYVFCIILRINDGYFPEQHWPAILCNGNWKCLHWGRNLTYNYNLHKFQAQKGFRNRLLKWIELLCGVFCGDSVHHYTREVHWATCTPLQANALQVL